MRGKAFGLLAATAIGAPLLCLTLISETDPVCDSATIVFAGDAMMHAAQIEAARQADGSYDFTDCFTAVSPYISEADYAVVNLEAPLGGKPYAGYPCFSAPDSYADALAGAGFDLFFTANNHCLDKRDRGARRTVDALSSAGIEHLGTYRDLAQRDSILPLIKDIGGIKVAFLNYTYGTNGIAPQGSIVVDYIDREKIAEDIRSARQKGAELVCAGMHWGYEYKLLPNAEQKALANFLVDQGVDLVIGSHPHVVQPMEMRADSCGRRSLVVYSLGNFISNMKTRDTRGGALAKAWISRGPDGRAGVDSAAYRLVFTIPAQGGENFRLVNCDDCDASAWKVRCNDFRQTATSLFDKHNRGVALDRD